MSVRQRQEIQKVLRRMSGKRSTWRQHGTEENQLDPSSTGRRATMVRVPSARKYTDKQGQYLAFIYYYTKIHGVAPAEAEIRQYFGVTPPSVHQMILTLEQRGTHHQDAGRGAIHSAGGAARGIAGPGMRMPALATQAPVVGW